MFHSKPIVLAVLAASALMAPPLPAQQPTGGALPILAVSQPQIPRTYDVRQIVTLKEIPSGSKRLRMWIAMPDDGVGQKMLDFKVHKAPGSWSIMREAEHGNRFLYVDCPNPTDAVVSVESEFTVRREPVHITIDPAKAGPMTPALRKQLAEYLVTDTPNMVVDERIQKLAAGACGADGNVASQCRKLFDFVADYADHYSKDPSKPKCGRGSAEDCLAQHGGCCTDFHSLFIALARARGIPARIQFGYRIQAKNEGNEHDPGYRCWAEYFVPNYGWVPTDIVAGDAGDLTARDPWVSGLDERRLWCCEGRNFELNPKQDGPRVNSMIIGYAEIDGKPVSVLPSADGKPSPLSRTVKFTERRMP